MIAPEWLVKRGGTLQLASDAKTWYVLIDGRPNYSLTVVPVAGKFGCAIRQTNSGARIASPGAFATNDDAIRGGLADLRKSLGWE